ncbi:hypothetical protein ACLB1E_05640 [Escherichia coli]
MSGCEKAVQVKVKTILMPSSKWFIHWRSGNVSTRQHDFSAGEGLYTHMKALRPNEARLSPLHYRSM